MKQINVVLLISALMLTACKMNNSEADAYGNFEAREVLVSSETAGRIVVMNIEEGQSCEKGFDAVVVDTIQYNLKIHESLARRNAAVLRKDNIEAQVNVYQQQKKVLQTDLERVKKMLADGAATTKQLDDIEGQILVLEKQILAVKSNLAGINAEVKAIDAAIAQIQDMIIRSSIKTPISGVIIAQYAEMGEMTTPGKPLFKIANLDNLELKAFISGEQLSQVAIGQGVKVGIDGENGQMIQYEGKVSWIASNAEFTPKNIQTKEERVSLVYAIKVKVKNDGAIKINMPGEVTF